MLIILNVINFIPEETTLIPQIATMNYFIISLLLGKNIFGIKLLKTFCDFCISGL